MSSVSIGLLLQSLILGAGSEYEAAYKETHRTGKPLLVMVTAKWCPACQKMKKTALPELTQKGTLKVVAFASVDFDGENVLAERLMRSDTLPQLIIFTRTDEGWKREQLIGRRSPGEIEDFVSRGVRRVARARAQASRDR